jgi:nucleotide-binding universal stress UspA family protein
MDAGRERPAIRREGADMETVVIAVDGSPASRAALDWALERATRVESTLVLTTVAFQPHAAFTSLEEIQPLYERVLVEAEERARAVHGPAAVTTALRYGVPVAELVTASQRASMLVVGTDKSSKVAGMVYGTLPLRVAARAHCPVVVVPESWTPREAPVLLGVGDDEPSPETTAFAVREATFRKTSLQLIHVWASSPIYPEPMRQRVTHVHESIRRSHAETLSAAAAMVRQSAPELAVEEQLVEGARIPHLIEAGEQAQLLVVGRRGGIMRGIVLGSAAHDVLLNPPCPIAVVPIEERASDEDAERRASAEHVR